MAIDSVLVLTEDAYHHHTVDWLSSPSSGKPKDDLDLATELTV